MEKKQNIIVNKFLYSSKYAPYVFVLPFILSFFIFFFYPIISTCIMSFQDVVGVGQNKFIGLKNYKDLLNVHFYTAVWNSVRYCFWTLLLLIPIPIVLAVFLNSKALVAKKFFRATIFMPAITSVVVAGIVFRLIFGETPGAPLNTILGVFGISPVEWLRNENTAMPLLVLLAMWRWTGINIIYFLSGLQNIPTELYESAEIDGANVFNKFRYVTVPLLKPIIIYVLTISIYGGLSMFTESFVFWQNHSQNDSGLTIVGYLYQQGFENGNLGFASATGLVLLLIVITLNLFQLKFFGMFKKEDA
ncbi:carbohydrate ABC transporter permease [Clostridium estertheticum]|uniref:carbohydrate ABC transporter permease n=1 Tax=Clostridium estertheticum TaxID=238834 RepID=UPI00209B5D23